MKKKVFLKAYFRQNLGDDLFIDHIANRYPNVYFKTIISAEYAKPFSTLNNFKNYNRFFRFIDAVIFKLFKYDLFRVWLSKFFNATVYIGGSIFIEPPLFDEKQKISLYKNYYILGANFGPYRTNAYYSFAKQQIVKTQITCFRDTYSYKLFNTLSNVRVAPDLLFAYKNYPLTVKGEGIGISIIDLRSRSSLAHMADIYYETIAKLLDLCKIKKIKAKLFCFCIDENDLNAAEEILTKTENKDVKIEQYDGDYRKFLDNFNSCEYILATRFHAMIIGWSMNKKVFPIAYSPKMTNVMKDVNYQGESWVLYENNAYKAKDLLDACMSSKELENLDQYIHLAEQHFSELDKLLY